MQSHVWSCCLDILYSLFSFCTEQVIYTYDLVWKNGWIYDACVLFIYYLNLFISFSFMCRLQVVGGAQAIPWCSFFFSLLGGFQLETIWWSYLLLDIVTICCWFFIRCHVQSTILYTCKLSELNMLKYKMFYSIMTAMWCPGHSRTLV